MIVKGLLRNWGRNSVRLVVRVSRPRFDWAGILELRGGGNESQKPHPDVEKTDGKGGARGNHLVKIS